MGFELQWNSASQALKQFRFMHKLCGTGLFFFFPSNVCKLTKIKGFFDYSSKLYLYVTCFQKESYKILCQM